MHSHARSHSSYFGLNYSLTNITIALLLSLFFLILLLFFMTITAPPAYGQQAVPPTARQAATVPQLAAKLAHPATRNASRMASPAEPRASYKHSMIPRRSHVNGGPLDDTLYTNGPINGTTDAWTVNMGFVVSDSFTVGSNGGTANGLSFGAWTFPGDVLLNAEVQITSAEFGGTIYSDQVVSFTQSGCSANQYGFNVCTETGSLNPVNLVAGTYWLNLDNAVVNDGNPLYWDENSGPSMASENTVGTIPSEAFTILGGTTTTSTTAPPPPPCFDGPIIHDFTTSYPSGVSLDDAGNVYGTTSRGGDNDLGLVYRLSQRLQNWIYAVLYSFRGGSNGNSPDGVTVGPGGILYGTAEGGIQNNNCGPNGCGVVYRLRPSPVACPSVSCNWNQTVLYRFTGSPDGASPNGNLVFDQDGNLYGTTGSGGAYGFGTIYELSPSNGGWTEKIIYSFSGGTDGWGPNSLVMGRDGNLYGATGMGGDPSCGYGTCGVIFQLVPSGNQWAERVLHTFENTQNDGQNPQSLARDGLGNLYGISTWMAGFYGDTGGVEFMLSPSNDNWSFMQLILTYQYGYQTSFTSLATDTHGDTSVAGSTVVIDYPPDCFNGPPYYCDWFILGRHGIDYPEAIFDGYGLATDPGGAYLYGVTANCGAYGQGTVFQY